MLWLEEIRTEQAFRALEEEWTNLLTKSKADTVFLTWDWLYHWWRTYKEGKELRIFLIRNENELVGVAPLCVSRARIGRFFPARQIYFLGSREVGSDYLDFILHPGKKRESIRLIFDRLFDNGEEWDVINLTDIPEDSENLKLITRELEERKTPFLLQDYTSCPYLPLPENPDSWLNILSQNMRYDIKRKRQRLEKEHEVKFVMLTEEEKLQEAFETLVKLNQMRMKEKRQNGAFLSTKFIEFHRVLVRAFFSKRILRLCFLVVDGIPIAGIYIFKYNGKYLYYQSGLASGWERFSPGTVLFSYCIEKAIEEGVGEFDFLRGEEDYKYRWTKNQRRNLQPIVFRKSLRGFAARLSLIL